MPSPIQRGKEAASIGKLSPSVPEEGHYACKTVQFFADGTNKQRDGIGSFDDESAFDLFADGSYRLSGKTDSLGIGSFRAGPGAGSLIFDEGILSIYFDRAIHARNAKGISVLYQSDYDSDDALDQMILCAREGAAQSSSVFAGFAARAVRNLAPPAHFGEPIDGLFGNVTWTQSFGPGFTSFQSPSYAFRAFFPNGYVWVGTEPADGDFTRLDCTKPMVDDRGEATCTTYALENGTLRIGADAAVPATMDASGLVIDGALYGRLPMLSGTPFDGSFRYFSYNGMAAFESIIRFTTDGTFQSSSGVGIAYTTPQIGDTQTTVTGYDEKAPIKGRYHIEGYTLVIEQEGGKTFRRFFAQMAEGMLYLNGDAYLAQDK
jgi:hypothetical protein